MFCWGRCSEGQLGLGEIEDENILSPRNLESTFGTESEIKDIVCGWEHTAVLKKDGVVYTCGSNENGQLGHNKDGKKFARVDALETRTVKQVVCGQMHTLAVTDSGLVLAWGDNTKGQLGLGNTENNVQSHPKIVRSLQSDGVMVSQVSCGARHSLALSTGGFLFSWGDNKHGQLGIGNSSPVHNVPEHVSSLCGVPFALICAGGYHSFALSLSGALFSWGRNNFGQLGINDNKDHSMPVLVKSLRSQRVRYVTAGEYHTAALTEDGGVFTFGWGNFGQLGHNSNSDECNPKKVFELMGQVVTQVACGRFHTLAYVASSGKLFSFGSGENGQLGNNKVMNINSPVAVHNSWVKVKPENHYVVHRIAAGGDHCYILVSKKVHNQDDCSPCDFRVQDRSKHLWTFTESSVLELVQQLSLPNPSTEIFHKLETTFSSYSCLNGSFLDRRNHEQTSSKIHGIHLQSARRSFDLLNGMKHKAIVTKLFAAFTHGVIHSLLQPPPDIEALRVYLLLPECSVYQNGEQFENIVIPFSEAILRLSTDARKVLMRWWSSLPSTFFSRTMKMFQDCVKYLLHFPPPKFITEEAVRRQAALATCLNVLEQLNTVNTESGDIVPFKQFYIPEIQATIDIRADFFNWIQNQIVTNRQEFWRHLNHGQTFSFCRYPFVFDAEAKTTLLQTDAVMQMQSAVEEVNRRNVRMMMSQLPIDPVNPILVIVVKRDSIVSDTLTQIMKCGPYDLKKPLKVVFHGEEGVDAGGVRKEFFLLLLTEILDPKYGMFTYIEESQTIWFNDLSFEESPMFLLIGVICGLAIYNSTIIDLRFPPVLYKKLLGRKPNLDDFRGFKPAVAKNLEYLLEYDQAEGDLAETFGLNFQVVREKYGALEYIDLIPDGGKTPVNLENRVQYVDVYIDYYLNKSVEKQFEAFAQGFHRVCGGKVMEFFHPEELMQMVVGCQDYDFRELEKVAMYKGEYFKGHPIIRNFWGVFFDFPFKMKKKFLAFLTGSDRVPILGMKSMKIIIQPVAGGEQGDHLPVAHTCFNLLDLPRYSTREMMKTKLSQAVEYSTGFGLA